jgi:hypothetical protein
MTGNELLLRLQTLDPLNTLMEETQWQLPTTIGKSPRGLRMRMLAFYGFL